MNLAEEECKSFCEHSKMSHGLRHDQLKTSSNARMSAAMVLIDLLSTKKNTGPGDSITFRLGYIRGLDL